LIDLISFVLGGAAGAAVAAATWTVARWAFARRTVRSGTDDEIDRMDPETADSPTSGVPGTSLPSRPPRLRSDEVRISERLLLELARLGRLNDETAPTDARTQRGLSVTVGASQSAVSKCLRRMITAGLVTEQRRHVVERRQRMKVYGLSRPGELLAREIAGHRGVSLLPPLDLLPGRRDTESVPPLQVRR
jgi:hypothetical protein